VITTGTLTKDDLSFIVDSLEITSAASSCPVITTNLSTIMYEEFRHSLLPPNAPSTLSVFLSETREIRREITFWVKKNPEEMTLKFWGTFCVQRPVSSRFYKRRADVVFAIYIAVVMYMHGVFSVISGNSSVKIWHPPRTGIEKGSEEGRGRGNELGAEGQYS
jgi:hypothetical protein